MMEEIKDLSEREFLEMVDLIYLMGYCDCSSNYVRDDRLRDIKTRIEQWLEI